jgi:hypothetical protein
VTPERSESVEGGGGRSDFVWVAAAVSATLVALHGVFTGTRIFFFRDLAFNFWPRSLWIRDELAAGRFPLWDPHPGYGQTAVADPLNQLFFLPSYVRFLFGDVVGFNLWVALPFPLAALGTYLYLRRHASRPASMMGAIAFACAGPVLSAGNVPNFSWAVCCLPWILWAADAFLDRGGGARFGALASTVALQALAGETVALVATCVVLGAYAVVRDFDSQRIRQVARNAALVGCSTIAGLLLAACQTFPLADMVSRSARERGFDTTLWALHPLRLPELMAPGVFGDYFGFEFDGQPLLLALNNNREPFLVSVYLGVGLLVLAAAGMLLWRERRLARFWAVVTGVGVLLSFGGHTIVYRALVVAIPALGSFRFPSKFLVVVAFAASVCASAGWDAVADRARDGRGARTAWLAAATAALAAVAALGALAALTMPTSVASTLSSLLASAGVGKSAEGAAFLVETGPLAALRLGLVAAIAATLVWIGSSRHVRAGAARAILLAIVPVDLLVAGWGLNPTIDAAWFGPPSWVGVTRAHPTDRLYVGGRVADLISVTGIDADGSLSKIALRADLPTVMARTIEITKRAHYSSAWGVRESISPDLPALRPSEYYRAVRLFERNDLGTRTRFLQRTGVRYFLMARPPATESRVVGSVPTLFLTMYEGLAPAPRAAVVPEAAVEPDLDKRIHRFLDSGFDPAQVVLLVEVPPEPAGAPSTPTAPQSAEITAESPTEVVVSARVPEGGGYLVLYDSFDPNWRAEVDGLDAPILCANTLFRAVRIAPGDHVVRFHYRPTPLYTGLAISLSTFVSLVLLALRWKPAAFVPRNSTQITDS